MSRSFLYFFLLFGVSLQIFCQNPSIQNDDYKKWSLKELLFSIDSGLLTEEAQNVYIEYYLQKAKRLKSKDDIVAGYKKKIGGSESYPMKLKYADSMYHIGKQYNDAAVIGDAYYYKAYAEVINKNYQQALENSLKSVDYLEDLEDKYTLHKVKNLIGNSYYHLEEYEKAYGIFETTTKYHLDNADKEYNHKIRYSINLYSLSKAAFRLKKFDTLQKLIQRGYKHISTLKSHHQPLEKAYFLMAEGMLEHTKGKYSKSDSLFSIALPEILKINDFANEHLIYLYQGKNLWKKENTAKATAYFMRIDLLYQNRQFMNKELSEAYTYLIEFFKKKNDPTQQLYYTNVLLKISSELQYSNRKLTNYIHSNFDKRELEASKLSLEKELSRTKSSTIWAYIIAILCVLGFALYYFSNRTKQRELKTKYMQLVNEGIVERTSSVTLDEDPRLSDKAIGNATTNDVHEILLRKLQKFEQEQGFLAKVSLEDLSIRLSTNRTTLSKLLNSHYGGYSKYINTLRINHAVQKIAEPHSKLHLLTTDALAEEFGFGNSKSFSSTFKVMAGMSVADFIKLSKKKHCGLN